MILRQPSGARAPACLGAVWPVLSLKAQALVTHLLSSEVGSLGFPEIVLTFTLITYLGIFAIIAKGEGLLGR